VDLYTNDFTPVMLLWFTGI